MAMLLAYSIECLQAALIPVEHKGSRTNTVSAQLSPETIGFTVVFLQNVQCARLAVHFYFSSIQRSTIRSESKPDSDAPLTASLMHHLSFHTDLFNRNSNQFHWLQLFLRKKRLVLAGVC